jgi:DNA polymerase-3 subunit alpha (Gram-positive type)
MYMRGIRFKAVDLEKSAAQRFLPESDGHFIRLPFVSLQGLGLVAAQNIVQAREKRPFLSIEDLRRETKASKTVIETLRRHGTLDGLEESNQTALF